MKKILLLHFVISLVTILISGAGLFLPALIGTALILAQLLAVRFELISGDVPEWYKILGICYAANFLAMLIGWII